MPVTIAFISQKGGVGKSTLARALAAVAAHAKLKVRLADLDAQQRTLLLWGKARKENRVVPAIKVEGYANVGEAIEGAVGDDLLIVDTPGQISGGTLDLAREADLIVQPTGPSLDDLHPAVMVFHALTGSGIPRERMVFALSRTSAKEEEDAAREYLEAAGYEVLQGAIPERVGYRQALNRGKAPTETEEKILNERADALLEALLEKVAAQLDGSKATMVKKRKSEGAA
jgi:chromosome partitioning protein